MTDGQKKGVAATVAVLGVAICGYTVWTSFAEPEVRADYRALKDIETGKVFRFKLSDIKGSYPQKNPKTGKATLYPTEVCYWGECGEQGGTYVILNVWRNKEAPTYCPVCGHVVRGHNPRPPGYTPPGED